MIILPIKISILYCCALFSCTTVKNGPQINQLKVPKQLEIFVRDQYQRYIPGARVSMDSQASTGLTPLDSNGLHNVFEKKNGIEKATLTISHPDYEPRILELNIDQTSLQRETVYLGKPGDLFIAEGEVLRPFTPFHHRLAVLLKPSPNDAEKNLAAFTDWLAKHHLNLELGFFEEANNALMYTQTPDWQAHVIVKSNGSDFDQKNSSLLAAIRSHEQVLEAGPLMGYQGFLTNKLVIQWSGNDVQEIVEFLEGKNLKIEHSGSNIIATAQPGIGLEILDTVSSLLQNSGIESVDIIREVLYSFDDFEG